MCIIALKTKSAKPIPPDTLARCFQNNKDGAGFAATKGDGEIVTERGFKSADAFAAAVQPYNKPGWTLLAHWRISTGGGIAERNCHPHPIGTSSHVVAHNGKLPKLDPTSKDSDTRRFTRKILRPYIEGGGSPKCPAFSAVMAEYIGPRNALVFLDGYGKHHIINESKKTHYAGNAHWDSGTWYSNESYKPKYDKANTSPDQSARTYQPSLLPMHRSAPIGFGAAAHLHESRTEWEERLDAEMREAEAAQELDEAAEAAINAHMAEANHSTFTGKLPPNIPPSYRFEPTLRIEVPVRLQRCSACETKHELSSRHWGRNWHCGQCGSTNRNTRTISDRCFMRRLEDHNDAIDHEVGDIAIDQPTQAQASILTGFPTVHKFEAFAMAMIVAGIEMIPREDLLSWTALIKPDAPSPGDYKDASSLVRRYAYTVEPDRSRRLEAAGALLLSQSAADPGAEFFGNVRRILENQL